MTKRIEDISDDLKREIAEMYAQLDVVMKPMLDEWQRTGLLALICEAIAEDQKPKPGPVGFRMRLHPDKPKRKRPLKK